MTTITTRRRPVTAAIVIAVVIGGLVVSACSDSKSSTKSFTKAGITVSDVWARESATATGNGAVYFTLENTSDKVDKLSSASVPSSFAKSAQIHETMMEGSSTTMDSMSSSTTVAGSAGMMAMQEVDSVTIPAGGTVAFEPGGYHVMLVDLAAPLKVGDTFTMSLDFMNAGVVQVTATVRAS